MGTIKTITEINYDGYEYEISDDSFKKVVRAQISFYKKSESGIKMGVFVKNTILWNGEYYDKAGDYTQEAIDKKIAEIVEKL